MTAAPPAKGGAGDEAAERLARLLARGQERWAAMDLQQRASTVALGLLAVVALPKVGRSIGRMPCPVLPCAHSCKVSVPMTSH